MLTNGKKESKINITNKCSSEGNMGFALTVIEIMAACIIIVGFINEEKLARFEQRIARIIKRRIRRSVRRRRASVESASLAARSKKYCA